MSRTRRIVGQTALLTAGNLAGLAVNFAATVLVTRALGPEGRGVYAWLLTLVGLAIQVAALASPPALRAIPDLLRPGVAAALPWLAGLGTCLTVPLLAYAYRAGVIGPGGLLLIPLAWLAVPVTAAGLGFTTLVQIEGRAGRILAVQVVPRLIQLALALLGLWFERLDLVFAVGLFVATACLELALAWLLAPHRSGLPAADPERKGSRVQRLIEVTRHLGGGWIAGLALFGLPRIGLLVLGAVAPLDRTGIYSVALTLQEVALVAPVALGAVLITHLPGERGRAARGANLAPLAAAILGCGIAALLSPVVVPLLFGAAFAEAGSLLRLLLPGVVCATVHQLCQASLYGRGSAKLVAVPALGGLVVAAGAAVLAVPEMGIAGAILSNISGYATLAALSLWLASRR